MENNKQNCPHGHGPMQLRTTTRKVKFRELELSCPVEQFICKECGLELATISQAGATQRMIADAYREEKGLLTSQEIKKKRKELQITQQELADIMSVGIASIKRWENGTIQTHSMDKLLRQALWPRQRETNFTGNRPFFVERVKLVLVMLKKLYNYDILKDDERLLYSGKLLWYADMTAYREFGRSITGATYAALPMGPQLNNYRDLVPEILKSDEHAAEPLSPEEKEIIQRVYERFPGKTDAYKASHQEAIWTNKRPGEIIPYTESSELIKM